MLTYLRNPITGYDYSFWPDAKFFYHYKIYRPLSFHVDWPITSREWYPEYWPSYRSYWHYLRDTPSENSFRQLRINSWNRFYTRSANRYYLNCRSHVSFQF
ncbi:unnamed protein product [Callosobruchus maculatus]|uniref:Uncharacterized protein n=1 Tax=Callosobruchus maculatus TaxID=64391 RepID=A0A653D1D3_CALMS|nr:unnamed protein product [Callosobruchus maculatus]